MTQPHVFRFGEIELDVDLKELRCSGASVALGPKPMALLLYLVENRSRVVSHEELKRHIWPDQAVVEAGALRQIVREARRALGDGERAQPRIRNARGFGYRFDAAEFQGQEPRPPALEAERREPETQGISETASEVRETAEDRVKGRASDAMEPPGSREIGETFLDRDAEMKRLGAALTRARRGEQQIILLNGPPGIGKTRLACELAREAAQQGFEVHTARCQPRTSGAPPYWPWVQLLHSWTDRHRGGELEAEALAPELAALLRERSHSEGNSAAAPAANARFLLFDAMARFLFRAARARPLLAVFDDLHLADEDSLALLLFLSRDLRRSPLLVAGTHRDVGAFAEGVRARALQEILREPGCSSLSLRGLTRTSVKRILARALDREPAQRLVLRVHAVTGGNPLFVAEITRLIATRGEAAIAGSRRIPISEALRDAVLARVAECSDPCRALLEAASTIGDASTLPVLRHMLALPEGTLLCALSEAESRELLRRQGSAGRYRFVHGVVREALYARLDGARSLLLHRTAGEALLALRGADVSPPLDQLAHHFCESAAIAQPERAIGYARKAAAEASRSHSYTHAVALYRKAFHALEFLHPPNPTLHATLLIELGHALRAARSPLESARAVFAQGIELARSIGARELFAHAALGNAGFGSLECALPSAPHAGEVRSEAAIRLLDEAQRGLLPSGNPRLRNQVLLAQASLTLQSSDPGRAIPLFENVLRCADDSDDDTLRREARIQAAVRPWLADRFPRLRPIMRELGRLDELGVPAPLRGAILACRASDSLARGDRAAADAAGEALIRIAQKGEVAEARPLACLWRSLRAQLDGRFEEAQLESAEAVRQLEQLDTGPEIPSTIARLHAWWISQLREPRAASSIPLWEAAARKAPQHPGPRLFLARLYAAEGRVDDARCELARVNPDQVCEATYSFESLAVFAEVAALVDHRTHASRLFDLLWPHRDRCIEMRAIVVCTGSVSRPLGSLAALLGRISEAVELFEHALERADSLGSAVLRVWTQLDYAHALRRHPQADHQLRARALVESAQKTAHALGLRGALHRIGEA